MKRKITIVDRREKISDAEIDRFKDFDTLLIKSTQKKIVWWKIILPILVILASISLYFLTDLFQEAENLPLANENALTILVDTLKELKAPVKDFDQPDIQRQPVTSPIEKHIEVVPKAINKPDSLPQKTESIYTKAEPVNGYDSLYNYFNAELIYPQVILKDSIEGVLTVIFTINKEGKPQNFQFPNSLGKPFEAEAIRLLERMPQWKAATVNGIPVSSKMSLPLTFRIER